ncbi:MAG: trypsin-like peptidase domain-containing protein [Acidobacteriota bacterium]
MTSSPKKFHFPLLSAFFLIFIVTAAVSATPSAKTVAEIKRGVVSITTFDAAGKPLLLGGGFFVQANRLITNIHVLKGASRAVIRTFDGQSFSIAGIVALNEDNDLALLQINAPANVFPLSLADNVDSEGEPVTLISALDDASWKVSSGVTNNLWYIPGAGEYLRITAEVRHGNSGSPLVNDKGEVVAVAALYFEGNDELSFAVPGEIIKSLLTLKPSMLQPMRLGDRAEARKGTRLIPLRTR